MFLVHTSQLVCSAITMSEVTQNQRHGRAYDPAIRELLQTLEIATSTKADQEVIEGLKRALLYADMRDDYALQCTSKESDTCRQITETTFSHPWKELKEQGKTLWNLTPRMLSGAWEGTHLYNYQG